MMQSAPQASSFGVAGHDDAVRAAGLQLAEGIRHSGQRIRPVGENGRRAVVNRRVAVNVHADMFAVAGGVREQHQLPVKIRRSQRPHTA